MDVFSVASRHVSWLQNRQLVLAENIANSDTPGYRSKDISSFELIPRSFSSTLTATNPLHFQPTTATAQGYQIEIVRSGNSDVAHSGNNVDLVRELRKVGEGSFSVTFDTSVSKIFHRLILANLKA